MTFHMQVRTGKGWESVGPSGKKSRGTGPYEFATREEAEEALSRWYPEDYRFSTGRVRVAQAARGNPGRGYRHTARYVVKKGTRIVGYHRSYSLALKARRKAGKGAKIIDRTGAPKRRRNSSRRGIRSLESMPGPIAAVMHPHHASEAHAKKLTAEAWEKGWNSAHERAIAAWRDVAKHASTPAKRLAAGRAIRTHLKVLRRR